MSATLTAPLGCREGPPNPTLIPQGILDCNAPGCDMNTGLSAANKVPVSRRIVELPFLRRAIVDAFKGGQVPSPLLALSNRNWAKDRYRMAHCFFIEATGPEVAVPLSSDLKRSPNLVSPFKLILTFALIMSAIRNKTGRPSEPERPVSSCMTMAITESCR